MKHLSPDEIVDVAEDSADARASAHAGACAECRERADAAAAAIRAARSAEAPEPSPLFWSHLSARIGAAIRREPARASFWRAWGWRLAPAAAVAVLVLAVGIALRPAPVRDTAPADETPAVGVPISAAAEDTAGSDAVDDPSWLLMSLLSDDVAVDDDAPGVVPGPGGAEKALVHLDDAERLELAKILRLELRGRASVDVQGPGA